MQVVKADRYRVAVFGGKASSNSSRIELILPSIKTVRIKDGIVQEQCPDNRPMLNACS